MGRLTGGGLVACLWLWTSGGGLKAAASDPSPAATYQNALDRFNHEDYSRALSLLAAMPAGKNAHDQADILNLKGAILLREHRDGEARAAFNEAGRLDPDLVAARFNEVEVGFREKHYAESRRQFAALLARTNGPGHDAERRFIEYKLMLADLLGGKEKPARDFIAAHRGDQPPPLAWYYLNAALEYQHGHTAHGDGWLQQVGTNYAAASGQVFADSFAELGWSSHGNAGAEHLAVREQAHGAASMASQAVVAAVPPAATAKAAPVRVAAVELQAAPPPPVATAKAVPAYGQMAQQTAALASLTTVAVVQLIPESVQSRTARGPFPDDASAASSRVAAQMPPTGAGINPPPLGEMVAPDHGSPAVAGLLAKSGSGRKSHASPSPSPSDSPAADGESASASPLPSTDAAASASPKPDSAPGASPSPAFVQKYEAAMVQFLQKDYAGAKKLLDEADAIQPNQGQSVTLRAQIFKQYYEAAYTAYQHADYPAALVQLDGADGTGTNAQNQSDAYNLRGLILSKQRNYEGAENMFHKAIQTDPGLWAAKFNYAEVPFNYRNFTVARTRFEELFSQTDPVKQPVEAELTQFKVFLTLLLEGKEDAARTFMGHFNFSGATPARYFCQAALNFYAGDVEKAQGWIDSARKEYPARKSSSFLEAFYRVGWLNDPNVPAATPGTELAAASPSAAPAASSPASTLAKSSPSASPAVAASSPAGAASSPAAMPAFHAAVTPPPVVFPTPVASFTPAPASPSPSAALLAKASPTAAPVTPAPMLMAKASASPTPLPTAAPALAKASASPSLAPSPTAPAMVKATVAPSPTATPAAAKASPTAAASPSATAVAKVSPTLAPSSPIPAVAKASATAVPSASVAVVAAASPKPVPAVAAQSPSPVPLASTTPMPPASTPAAANQTAAEPASTGGDFARIAVVVFVLLYFVYSVARIVLTAMGRKSKRLAAADASSSYRSTEEAKADELEAKR